MSSEDKALNENSAQLVESILADSEIKPEDVEDEFVKSLITSQQRQKTPSPPPAHQNTKEPVFEDEEVVIEPKIESDHESSVEKNVNFHETKVEPTMTDVEHHIEHVQETSVEHIEEPSVEHTEEPSFEHTEEPSVEHTEEPTLEHTEEPTLEEPTLEEPAAEEPIVEDPTLEEPTAEEPTAEEPIAEEPIAEESIAEEPILEKSQVYAPVEVEPKEEASIEVEPKEEAPIEVEMQVEAPIEVEMQVEAPVEVEMQEETPIKVEPKEEAPVEVEPKEETPVAPKEEVWVAKVVDEKPAESASVSELAEKFKTVSVSQPDEPAIEVSSTTAEEKQKVTIDAPASTSNDDGNTSVSNSSQKAKQSEGLVKRAKKYCAII